MKQVTNGVVIQILSILASPIILLVMFSGMGILFVLGVVCLPVILLSMWIMDRYF